MQRRLLSAVILFALFPLLLRAQAGSPKAQISHDLSATEKVFDDYAKDFRAMTKTAQAGAELETLMLLDDVAATAENRLFSANAELQMYDTISCEPDRAKVRQILKKQLEYYHALFDDEVTRTNSVLALVKVPAAAQTGLRMKDDLRTAKEKLFLIYASLLVEDALPSAQASYERGSGVPQASRLDM